MSYVIAGILYIVIPFGMPVLFVMRKPERVVAPWLFCFCGWAVTHVCLWIGMFIWFSAVRLGCIWWYGFSTEGALASLSITMPDMDSGWSYVSLAVPLLLGTLLSVAVLRRLACRFEHRPNEAARSRVSLPDLTT